MRGQKQGLKTVNANSVPHTVIAEAEHLVRAHPVAVKRVWPRPRPPKSHTNFARLLAASMERQEPLSNDRTERVGPKVIPVGNVLAHASP